MARLKLLDGSGDIEISTFNRPCLWFDEVGFPRTDGSTQFYIRSVKTRLRGRMLDSPVKLKLSENDTVLLLRGTFSELSLMAGKAVFDWDACQWFEVGAGRLYVDRSSEVFRINGEDYLEDWRTFIDLYPEPVFDVQ